MPHTLEVPWMLGAVVPLVCRERLAIPGSVVSKLAAFRQGHSIGGGSRFAALESWLKPCFTTVIRSLHNLPEPSAALRCVNPVGIRRGTFQVIHFPSAKKGTLDFPLFTCGIRRKNECAFFCPDKYACGSHNKVIFLF